MVRKKGETVGKSPEKQETLGKKAQERGKQTLDAVNQDAEAAREGYANRTEKRAQATEFRKAVKGITDRYNKPYYRKETIQQWVEDFYAGKDLPDVETLRAQAQGEKRLSQEQERKRRERAEAEAAASEEQAVEANESQAADEKTESVAEQGTAAEEKTKEDAQVEKDAQENANETTAMDVDMDGILSEPEEANDHTNRMMQIASLESAMQRTNNPALREAMEKEIGRLRLNDVAAAAEADPGRWMSDEERNANDQESENQAEKRESKVRAIVEKIKSRKVMQRLKRAAIVAMGALMLGSGASSALAPDVEAWGAENTDEKEGITPAGRTEAAQAAYRAAQEAIQESANEMGITPEAFVSLGEIDFSQYENLEEMGAVFYGDEFMAREGSEVLPNGLMTNYTEYNTANAGKNSNHFATSLEYIAEMQEGRDETLVERTIATLRDQPEAMAAFVANVPQILEAAGVDASIVQNGDVFQRSQAVANLLEGENGGSLQKKLLAATVVALKNESTEFNFYTENGLEQTFYMNKADTSAPASAENMQLSLDVKQRHDAKQTQIVFKLKDGSMATVDLNLGCQQPNLEVDAPVSRTPVAEVVTWTLAENPIQSWTVVEQTPEETPVEIIENTKEKEPTINEDKPEGQEPGSNDSNDNKPGGEEPGEEDTGGEDNTGDEDPGEQPGNEDTGGEDTGGEDNSGEEIKQKDEENEKRVVEEGGQTNPVDQTPQEVIDNNVQGTIVPPSNQTEDNQINSGDIQGNLTGTYDETLEENATPQPGNSVLTDAGQVADETVSADQQQTDRENQEAANLGEIMDNMTDDEFSAWVNGL